MFGVFGRAGLAIDLDAVLRHIAGSKGIVSGAARFVDHRVHSIVNSLERQRRNLKVNRLSRKRWHGWLRLQNKPRYDGSPTARQGGERVGYLERRGPEIALAYSEKAPLAFRQRG